MSTSTYGAACLPRPSQLLRGASVIAPLRHRVQGGDLASAAMGGNQAKIQQTRATFSSNCTSKARKNVRRQRKRYTWRKALSAVEEAQPTTNVARTSSEKNIVTTSNLAASIDNKQKSTGQVQRTLKNTMHKRPTKTIDQCSTRASHRHNKQCSKHTQHTEFFRAKCKASSKTPHTTGPKRRSIDQCSNQGLTSSQQAM